MMIELFQNAIYLLFFCLIVVGREGETSPDIEQRMNRFLCSDLSLEDYDVLSLVEVF